MSDNIGFLQVCLQTSKSCNATKLQNQTGWNAFLRFFKHPWNCRQYLGNILIHTPLKTDMESANTPREKQKHRPKLPNLFKFHVDFRFFFPWFIKNHLLNVLHSFFQGFQVSPWTIRPRVAPPNALELLWCPKLRSFQFGGCIWSHPRKTCAFVSQNWIISPGFLGWTFSESLSCYHLGWEKIRKTNLKVAMVVPWKTPYIHGGMVIPKWILRNS